MTANESELREQIENALIAADADAHLFVGSDKVNHRNITVDAILAIVAPKRIKLPPAEDIDPQIVEFVNDHFGELLWGDEPTPKPTEPVEPKQTELARALAEQPVMTEPLEPPHTTAEDDELDNALNEITINIRTNPDGDIHSLAGKEEAKAALTAWSTRRTAKHDAEVALKELELLSHCHGGGNWRRVLIQRGDYWKRKAEAQLEQPKQPEQKG